MKKSKPTYLLFLLLILLVPGKILAQKAQNHWYMGAFLGMQFNDVNPPTVLNDSKMYGPYATATMSDVKTGKLLFYTNGVSIWNANHQQMKDGDNLLASAHCMEVIISPVPENESSYYVFSIGQDGIIYYALVNMKLENGFGAVVYKKKVLASFMENHFTVVKHEYENGYWLIGHRQQNNEFLAFRINKDKIDTVPVVSFTGSNGSPPVHAWKTGQLVASNNGRKLAWSLFGRDNVEIFDFDKTCGTVSFNKSFFLRGGGCSNARGMAFAPKDTFLYISYFCTNTSKNYLLKQYNVFFPDPSQASVTLANTDDALREMRLGPDGKIYIVTSENGAVTSKLDVILYPDRPGLASEYRKFHLRLHPGNISYFTEHLPNYIHDTSQLTISAEKAVLSFSNACFGETVVFTGSNTLIKADSVRLDFGDSTVYRSLKPITTVTKKYDTTGKFIVKYSWFRCGYEYFSESEIEIYGHFDFSLGKDTTLCSGTGFLLKPSGSINFSGLNYHWSNGSMDTAIAVTKSGKYYLTLKRGNCVASDTVNISFTPEIRLQFGGEYFICENDDERVKLDAGPGFREYKWQPSGETTQWIEVANAGDYVVTVKDSVGCEGGAQIKVKRKCPVAIEFPNAFSPNDDALNDEFKPVAQDVVDYNLKIFNRWGEKIFESTDVNKGWDGLYRGKKVPDGAYLWMADYTGFFNKEVFRNFHKTGYFTLIRYKN